MAEAMQKFIHIRGARTHNLRDVSLDIPRDQLVVITGLSGSGKSSLAFDTIYAEGQRKYVESLSAYARQFLGQMIKPDVEQITGLPPTIAIAQQSVRANPRSTVATATEVYDFLRLLFARVGQPTCPTCGKPVSRQTRPQIVEAILALPDSTKVMILAPLVRNQKGEHKAILARIQREGFVRVRIDGELYEAKEAPKLDPAKPHRIEAIVDRLIVKPDVRSRLSESIETSLKIADGLVIAASQSSMASANVKASSCAAVQPASRMW
jgi:excinuclease ABC subunit A